MQNIAIALLPLIIAIGFVGKQSHLNNKAVAKLQGVGGQKLCSYFIPGNWRDSVVVPATWSKDVCQSMALKTGASHAQLGCVFPDGVDLGKEAELRDAPSAPLGRNCGW